MLYQFKTKLGKEYVHHVLFLVYSTHKGMTVDWDRLKATLRQSATFPHLVWVLSTESVVGREFTFYFPLIDCTYCLLLRFVASTTLNNLFHQRNPVSLQGSNMDSWNHPFHKMNQWIKVVTVVSLCLIHIGRNKSVPWRKKTCSFKYNMTCRRGIFSSFAGRSTEVHLHYLAAKWSLYDDTCTIQETGASMPVKIKSQ